MAGGFTTLGPDGTGDVDAGPSSSGTGFFRAEFLKNYNFCIVDDRTGRDIQINLSTEEFSVALPSGMPLEGKANITHDGFIFRLHWSDSDSMVDMTIDTHTHKASAIVKQILLVTPSGTTSIQFELNDSDTGNNNCP